MLINTSFLRFAPLLAGLVLAGCAGSDSAGNRTAYLLPETPASQQYDAHLSVMVAPVTTAAFLDNDGIVMQLNHIEVHQARHHLWAEALPAQLRQLLIHRLATAMPGSQVVARGQPQGPAPGREVRIQLDRFQGRFDGVALIRGHWQILDKQKTLLKQQSFTVETPLNEDGYPELVRALASGWEQVADQLAQALADSIR
ncbi:PqiC family protein [Oceanimonas baumannii]|uniref:PqiC family protein n=1 Tax=Oceanimonas baumannii TaxID=129578 RepID=UPI003A92AB32